MGGFKKNTLLRTFSFLKNHRNPSFDETACFFLCHLISLQEINNFAYYQSSL